MHVYPEWQEVRGKQVTEEDERKNLSLIEVLKEHVWITVEQEESERHISAVWETEGVIASRGSFLTSSLSPTLPLSMPSPFCTYS